MKFFIALSAITAFAIPANPPVAKEIGRYRCGQVDYAVTIVKKDIRRTAIIHSGCMSNPDSLWIEWGP